MARVRRAAPLLLAVLALSGCGGGSGSSTTSSSPDPTLTDATLRTIEAGTARFELTVSGKVAGVAVRSEESGSVSFTRRRAHLYKLIPSGGLPQEVVMVGPLTYTNANVEAAMSDPTAKPWTKLDTSRLSAAQRLRRPDELAHVSVPAYLADGVAHAVRVPSDGTTGSPDICAVRQASPSVAALTSSLNLDRARLPHFCRPRDTIHAADFVSFAGRS